MDDSWQKFMNPMNDDAVGPAAAAAAPFRAPPHSLTLSIPLIPSWAWHSMDGGIGIRASIPPCRRRRRCPPNPALPSLPYPPTPSSAGARTRSGVEKGGQDGERAGGGGTATLLAECMQRRWKREGEGRNVRGIFEQALLCNNGVLEGGREERRKRNGRGEREKRPKNNATVLL